MTKNGVRLVLWGCCLFLVLAGCGRGNTGGAGEGGVSTMQSGMDARLFDQEVTEDDALLHQGDAGLDKQVPGVPPQNGTAGGGGTGPRALQETPGMAPARPNPAIAPQAGGYTENVLSTAAMYFGTPYEYGSDRSDPSTFDCSDYTRWSYLYALGMNLPQDSRSQAQYVRSFSSRVYTDIHQAQRGDLLFFIGYRGGQPDAYRGASKAMGNISHCGLYLGNGKMIHTASARTGGVRIDNVFDNHLEYRFVMGGSVLQLK
ncbi:C40 family peptidase [Paenibacillus mucilaginosus]|nr:C40 family peptidase [Paenibacillus mucilaginosus]AEI40055.1 NLP/P60 family protein [Paenibacillus mucilaginosus KNP414]MCG7215662.1 C40 family peptidase [Paenibacillus mucilaginosus]WDM29295.1 C40 family peptidase [Paenibacillus mucilaginosus]